MEQEILIRKYQASDESAIEEITYRTGFKGEDLTRRGVFGDRRLFFMIFIRYYCLYEPEHFFVAVDKNNNEVIGFICGTPDTERKEAQFMRKVAPRILLRAFFFTLWRYPRSFINALRMMKGYLGVDTSERKKITDIYPAHLHINLLEGFQGKGLGTKLMNQFIEHMRSLGVDGIHLETTSKNVKAIPFYKKMGFEIVRDSGIMPSRYFDDIRYLTMAKKLG